MPCAHPHWVPDSATRIRGWEDPPYVASRAPGSRSRGPGVSVTWAMAARAPHLASMAQPRGAEGGTGECESPGPCSPSAPSAACSSSQPVSQPAEVPRSSRLLPASAPFAAPEPQRPRAARRRTGPGSPGELQLGPSPFSQLE